MNKKLQYQMLLMILGIIVIFNLAIIFTNNDPAKEVYNVTEVGKNANGTVYKIIAGNKSSNDTVGLILGVHPREHEIHEAVNETIYNITKEGGANNLSKKYVIYYVKVNDNLKSREETRDAGELLANKYVVNKIAKDKPFIVLDIHEIDPTYEYSDFIFSLSNRTAKVNATMENITKEVNLEDFPFDEGTSPDKVTRPIANKGITTFLLETSIQDNMTQKQKTAEKIINCVDGLTP